MVNFVGGCVSSYAANYFMGGQQRQQSSSNQNSCWDNNQWDTKWSTPGSSAGSAPNPDSANNNDSTYGRDSASGNSQSRGATRPTIVDSLFQATGTEKPKDTAGWIELGVKSFASLNRKNGNGNK